MVVPPGGKNIVQDVKLIIRYIRKMGSDVKIEWDETVVILMSIRTSEKE